MYRILWTHQDVENGGYYSDVDAPDPAAATWQAGNSAHPGQDGKPPVLVSVTELPPAAPPAVPPVAPADFGMADPDA